MTDNGRMEALGDLWPAALSCLALRRGFASMALRWVMDDRYDQERPRKYKPGSFMPLRH
jgi:hypothetical protein